jgi:hypothetical protein
MEAEEIMLKRKMAELDVILAYMDNLLIMCNL